MKGGRTLLVLIDNQVPLPLGHHRKVWSSYPDSNRNFGFRRPAPCPLDDSRKNWYAHEDLNPDIQIRSLAPSPLDDGRENW